MVKDHRPPRLPQRFLRWYCKPGLLEDIEGDIEEDFNKRYTRSGKQTAQFYYWLDVLRFFRPFAIKRLFKIQINNMFKLNTIIAFRNLAKHKLYSFINISGLGIGIAACLVIAHYVIFQLGYDRFHENADRIYRVHTSTVQGDKDWGASAFSGFALAPSLARDIPEFEAVIRAHPYYGGAVVSRVIDSVNTGAFREQSMLFADPDVLKVLSFEFVQGDPIKALDDPNSIVITEGMKAKYFGNDNELVLGELLNINGGWARGDLKITGVIKAFPKNSHFKFDFLMPLDKVLMDEQYQSEDANWGWSNFYTYALLNPETEEEAVESKIAGLMHKYQGESLESDGFDQTLSLQQLPDIHLNSETGRADDMSEIGDLSSVYFMIVIALFILIIAWINFINLATAKASERGMEIGIKKAMGARKGQLMSQFLTESFWVNLMAILLAVVITYASMPYLSEAIGVNLEVNLLHPVILSALIGLALAGPLLAGLYPAVVMSSFRTVTALKGKNVSRNKYALNLRRSLVVFQFVISTLLIAGTFTVSRQLKFMQHGDKGLNLSQILTVKGPEVNVSRAGFEAFKNSMSQFAPVEAFSSSRSVPGAGYNWNTEARKSGQLTSEGSQISVTWVDENFLEAFGMELVSGRNFEFTQERIEHGLIINEACLDHFGLGTAEDALNEKIILSGDTIWIRGVVKNHHWNSLHSDFSPATFKYRWASIEYFSMKVNPQNIEPTIKEVEKQFAEAFPGNPVEYYFLDDFFNRQYQADLAFANLFKAFSLFAILAACMGLFGLASYSVVQKAKEIGIRRVLGASGMEITVLFSKRYLFLTLIANLIAIPIAYFGIQDWLSDFAFSIDITPELFIIPMVILLAIATLTVSLQTLRASLANPVKNLRSE